MTQWGLSQKDFKGTNMTYFLLYFHSRENSSTYTKPFKKSLTTYPERALRHSFEIEI